MKNLKDKLVYKRKNEDDEFPKKPLQLSVGMCLVAMRRSNIPWQTQLRVSCCETGSLLQLLSSKLQRG